MEVLGLKDTGSYGVSSELDRNQPNYYYDEALKKATLSFSLIGLKKGMTDFKFQVSSVINGMGFDGRDGNRQKVNVASKEKALKTAFQKGLKRMQKGMVVKGA